MQYLNTSTLKELNILFQKLGEPKFRAKQLFHFIHHELGQDIFNCSTFSKELRQKLNLYPRDTIEILLTLESKIDHTKKFLFQCEDGEIVEGVLMEYNHGLSQCISTQVGCKMGCTFCASTKEGCIRNLRAGEMLEQVYSVERKYGKISNIILMGSGEPFDNRKEVFRFLELLHDSKGQNMSYRNMTISTCGIVPGILELANMNLPITLAISLHSPFQEDREKIMPISKKYPIEEIIKACKYYFKETGRRVTFEYVLIDGVNNREKDIMKLKELLGDMPHHINVIPLNPIKEYNKKKPASSYVLKFQRQLKTSGLSVTIRRELGADIDASCGQLRRRWQSKEKV
ncbi:MAG: 23S rRNA (adenine(2503)-C(2))-methyltransferase RlmN [Tissierellia bacterium]|nr:23S rRNA (adenine(2503)-C(2))-methyltransferase RlmN [Tissierellia bacterium]